MINETGNTENTNFSDEVNNSPFEAKRDQFKELGRKSLDPLLSVLTKHKSDFSPYLDALTKALKSGAGSLQNEEASEADKFISQYFTDGAEWIGRWKEKLSSSSPEQFMHFVEEEGQKKPAILFGASYFAGVILGRFGRHLGKTMRTGSENIH
ncbi:MAG: hypothetical protein V4598_09240 [Bdellovibrionota bacterium]